MPLSLFACLRTPPPVLPSESGVYPQHVNTSFSKPAETLRLSVVNSPSLLCSPLIVWPGLQHAYVFCAVHHHLANTQPTSVVFKRCHRCHRLPHPLTCSGSPNAHAGRCSVLFALQIPAPNLGDGIPLTYFPILVRGFHPPPNFLK